MNILEEIFLNEEFLNRNRNINRGFRKLDVWKEAVKLFIFEKRILDQINNLSYKLKGQIESSIFSVHSNIAEGYGRRSLKETIQFNNIALSSLGENYSQFFSIYSANYIKQDIFNEFDNSHYSLENKLIAYNRSQVEQLKQKSDWHDDYIVRELIEEYEG